jgi:hypothetical protein
MERTTSRRLGIGPERSRGGEVAFGSGGGGHHV